MVQDIFELINKEKNRQNNTIELIASENFVSKNILKAQGSVLTNKYAEGVPYKRYYGGCEIIDEIETRAIEDAKKIFEVKYANVQPHSGSAANMAVYRALLKPKDKVLSMKLEAGGHLSHGSSMSFSGMDYEFHSYNVDKETNMLNYNDIRRLALKVKPKLIIAGASSYPRKIDFEEFRKIADEVGAYLMVDMAHIAGLVAAGLHQNPCKYADVVTSTTHKTLRGPRGGIILTNDSVLIGKINKAVFPGIQGGPLEHVIAAKAVCFEEAMNLDFIKYQKQIIKNAKVLCDVLKMEGFKIVTNGTDNHLLLVDTKKSIGMTGKEAENVLEKIGITCNKNMIPYDPTTPYITSGIRLGTPAMTTRGFSEKDFVEVGKIISLSLKNSENKQIQEELKIRVSNLLKKYPLYEEGDLHE